MVLSRTFQSHFYSLVNDTIYRVSKKLKMSKKIQQQVSQERFDIIQSRYQKYLDNLNNPNSEPVRVFDPLAKKQIEELELIREVSKELQFKKEEDIKKAAQAAIQAAEEEAKKKAEEEKQPKEETQPEEESEKK